ncbi:MAG: thermonuclease family protein [Kiritimatiellia bacterium]
MSAAGQEWEELKGCKLEDNFSNDGDSFHVQYQGRSLYFRLYFVDCAETNEEYPDRVKDQSSYWDIEYNDAIKVGKEAKHFTKDQLSQPFTVYTVWKDAKGGSGKRYFAFVTTHKGKDLGELLTENGLVRVYGASATHPDGTDSNEMFDRLRKLEHSARNRHLGAWSREYR